MSKQGLVSWLSEIGDDIMTGSLPTDLIKDPIQTLRKKKTDSMPPNQADSIRELVRGANTLAELQQMLERFDGCELKKTANRTVFGDGNPESKIMLIGEAPGADEDREGLPFVGASGKLLDQMFQHIGLTRANYYITNIIPWRPPGNRNPTQEEIEMCMPFVERRIELIQPKVIVMIGGVSAKSILNVTTGITSIRGHWYGYKTPSMDEKLEAYAVYHPSYLLRSPGQKRVVWHDLLVLKQKLAALGLI